MGVHLCDGRMFFFGCSFLFLFSSHSDKKSKLDNVSRSEMFFKPRNLKVLKQLNKYRSSNSRGLVIIIISFPWSFLFSEVFKKRSVRCIILEMAGNKTQKGEKSRDETQRRRRRRRIPNNEDIYNKHYVLLESTIHAVIYEFIYTTQTFQLI